jgi:vancomycin aglycone glucosyltransferase
VADKLGIRYVLACFHLLGLPSRHRRPGARPGTPSPQDETDNRVLWEQDAQRVNALYGPALNSHRAAIGLPPVDNVRDYVLTDRPTVAGGGRDALPVGGPVGPRRRADRGVDPARRPPAPDELQAFLDAGEPPVYVGFGSMATHAPEGHRAADRGPAALGGADGRAGCRRGS